MLEEYMKMIEQLCSANIAAEVRAIDMTQANSQSLTHNISQGILKSDNTDCFDAYVGYLAYSINNKTAPGAIHEFLASATAVSPAHRVALQKVVARAYTYITPSASNHKMYFNVAGLYGLQLPENDMDQFSGADFSDHTDPAMSYHKYLILIGDPRGVERFDMMLGKNSDDIAIVFGLVSALSDLAIVMHREGRDLTSVSALLERYKDDSRRTVGVNGPGTGAAPQDVVRPILAITKKQ